MKINILIVDDNAEILHILHYHLKKQGYIVYKAQCGNEALSILSQYKIDMAILDVMMPDIDGYSLCKNIRKKYFFPILFLTAKSRENDKIKGLMCGGDDYMLKPFSSKELIARVSSLLRRSTVYNTIQTEIDKTLKTGNLILDEDSGIVKVNKQTLDLTDIEYKILLLLLKNKGNSLSTKLIFSKVWGGIFTQTSNNTVVVHIKNIRKKIHQLDPSTEYIHTVWGKGYEIYG